MITSIGDMNCEIANRCRDLGLAIDCGVDGLFNSEIALVAEAPGERERANKIPLCGSSGKLLWDMVRPVGINRRGVYISNVVKRQLRQTDDEKVSITKNEVDHYASILRWELEQLPNLKYILVLGNYALEAVTGLSGIMHHRGSVYDTRIASESTGRQRDVQVIALLNPAAVIREPKWEIMYKFDVARVKRVLDGQYSPHQVESIINPSPREAVDWIDKMQDENSPVALDIETIAQETACVGLANSSTIGMCINFRDRSSNRYSTHEEIVVRKRLQQFGQDERTKLVMQNGMFDSYWLACKDRILLRLSYFDTMLAHHTLYPTLPHNLGFLTSQYTEHPFYKDDGKQWREGGDIDSFWRYNVTDCCITLACYQREIAELRQQKLDEFFFNHVMRLQPHLINMVVQGVKVDALLKQKIGEDLAVEVHRLKEEFFGHVATATGDDTYRPNPKSPKQMSELFFRRLRLVGRGVATDVKNRARMRSHPRTTEDARSMIDSLDKWAKEEKFLNTYAEMTVDPGDRVRCEYKQTGVQSAPGRLSSSQTMWGSGGNLQNQPGRAQKMFVADQGCGFSYFDLAQAEARVVAWKYNIQKWMDQFEQARIDGKYDCHRALASEMYNIPYDDVPTKDWEDDEVTMTIRYKAKRCRHGLNYRMGPDKLAETAGMSMREAEDAYRIYHRITPELEAGWNATSAEVRKSRSLYNAYGRRWILLERLDDESLKSIVAFYPQSTIGDKVSRCIYLCESDPEWPTGSARMALNIHDALIAVHDLAVGEQVRRVMKRHAEEPINITDIFGTTRQLIIPSDFKASVEDETGYHRWSTLQKVKVL